MGVCVCVRARAQSCLTLCNPMDCSPPDSSVHRIFQARILKWVAFPFPGNIPNPRIEPASLVSPTLAGRFFTTVPSWKPTHLHTNTHLHTHTHPQHGVLPTERSLSLNLHLWTPTAFLPLFGPRAKAPSKGELSPSAVLWGLAGTCRGHLQGLKESASTCSGICLRDRGRVGQVRSSVQPGRTSKSTHRNPLHSYTLILRK